jgi:hypothetical protein
MGVKKREQAEKKHLFRFTVMSGTNLSKRIICLAFARCGLEKAT